jgi:hypothetical protein
MPLAAVASESPTHQFEWIVQELGPAGQDIAAVLQNGKASWVLQFENQGLMHLAWRHDPPRLELMTPVAQLDPDASAQALRPLLMFNFLSADTAGSRMALSAHADTVFLVRDIPEAQLSVQNVLAAMRGAADVASKWRQVLRGLSSR